MNVTSRYAKNVGVADFPVEMKGIISSYGFLVDICFGYVGLYINAR